MAEMVVIDDSNWQRWTNPIVDGQRRLSGYWGMWESQTVRGAAKTFQDLIDIPLIPESEWDDRIDQLERDKATIKDLCQGCELHVLDQNGTNYCWINAPTFCCMVTRLQETSRAIRYSPASGGAPIKNFANRGGWGSQALEWFKKNGVNLQDDWPPNAINRQYYTDENKEKAKRHITLEYFKLDNWHETGSCILAGVPVAVGYNWWSHEVTGVGVVKGSHDLVIANSWGRKWSDDGYGVLKGQKKIPDDAVAIVAMTAL